MKMGRIVVTGYMSIDGVAEAPSGTESFERIGWTDTFCRGPESDKFKLDETMNSDALLLGRMTTDGFAAGWPHYQVYPLILGAGKRLFGETSATKRLRLTSSRTGGGIHLLIYKRDN